MAGLSQERREALGYNPHRTADLYALTTDGYIIAQDIASQYEYILERFEGLTPIAHINRSFQGLSEIVALDRGSGERLSFIFDISNEVYQAWMAAQFGSGYQRGYDGPPRQPAR